MGRMGRSGGSGCRECRNAKEPCRTVDAQASGGKAPDGMRRKAMVPEGTAGTCRAEGRCGERCGRRAEAARLPTASARKAAPRGKPSNVGGKAQAGVSGLSDREAFPWRRAVRSECQQALSAAAAVPAWERSASTPGRKAGGGSEDFAGPRPGSATIKAAVAAIRMREPSFRGSGTTPSGADAEGAAARAGRPQGSRPFAGRRVEA